MASPKPIKLGESRAYEVDGMTVVLKRIEPTYYTFERNLGGGQTRLERGAAEQKSRHEILVNDKLFGWINCPSGFGSGWEIVALARVGEGIHPGLENLGRPRAVDTRLMKTDRDILVGMVPDLIRQGKLIPQDRLDVLLAKAHAEAAERAAEREAERREAPTRQAAERAKRRKERAVEREAIVERIEGLELVMQRMLTNLERTAVVASLAIVKRELSTHDSQTLAFYSDEYQGV